MRRVIVSVLLAIGLGIVLWGAVTANLWQWAWAAIGLVLLALGMHYDTTESRRNT